MNRQPQNGQISELRLEQDASTPAPAQPTPDASTEIILEQFSSSECIAGAMENGDTFGAVELGPGVQGITCKRAADGPAEVQVLKFDSSTFDQESAKAWAQSNTFLAWSRKVAARHELMAWKKPRVHTSRFQAEPGTPENPDAPKLSEGMETFRSEVMKAIDAKGWSYLVSMQPEFDFVIEELWPDRVLVIDTLTGTYYSILAAMTEDGSVDLGTPTPVDITISIPEGQTEIPPAIAAHQDRHGSPVLRNVGTQALVASRQGGGAGKGVPLYRVLLCQGGWTRDQRYITDDCLREAVKLGKFDGAKCWYGHPEPQADGRRSRLAVGFVKPGSVMIEMNKANHVDVWGDIALMRTDDAAAIGEFLDQSLEIGVPLMGVSVYCRETENYFGEIEGRRAQIYARFLSDKVAVDFVDDPAFPRAGATEKLAAHARTNTGDILTMDEKLELQRLRKETSELKAAAAQREREVAVDKELAATGWPKEFQAAQRAILLEIAKPQVRKAHIASMNLVLGQRPGVRTGLTGGPTDAGFGIPSRLSPKIREELAAIAKKRGWKEEAISRAEATAFGR